VSKLPSSQDGFVYLTLVVVTITSLPHDFMTGIMTDA
jgi:hypothetical protein